MHRSLIRFGAVASIALVSQICVAASVLYEQDFDVPTGGSTYVDADGALGPEWSFFETNEGRSRIYDWGGSRDGVLVLDDYLVYSDFSLVEAILEIDLTNQSGVTLSFDHYDSNDYDHNIGTSPFTNHRNADGVAVSSDGTNWVPIVDFQGRPNRTWETFSGIDLSGIIASNSLLSLSSSFLIKFQQYDDSPHAGGGYHKDRDGRKFDNILVMSSGAPPGTGNPIPEPATATLFGVGLLGMAYTRRRHKGRKDQDDPNT